VDERVSNHHHSEDDDDDGFFVPDNLDNILFEDNVNRRQKQLMEKQAFIERSE